jgi:hypothetical protein
MFIFFVTYEWGSKPRVLNCTRLDRQGRDKQSNLLGPFVSHDKIKCHEYDLWSRTLFSNSTSRVGSWDLYYKSLMFVGKA